MARLKELRTWVILIILFYMFTNAIIYIYLYPEKVGGTIYNIIHIKERIHQENR